jgi:hypothetical protein
MDIPIHIAAAAFVCNVTLYADSKIQKNNSSKKSSVRLCMICFVLSLFSHLLLDAAPHYDFIYKILRFSMLPQFFRYGWVLFKVGVFTLPVVIMFLYLTRDHWLIALVSIFGSVYPDIEKGAYLNLFIPKYLIIFRHHSCSYSPAGWESEHKLFLIIAELCLFVVLLIGLYWVARYRNQFDEINKDTAFLLTSP